MIIWEAKTCMSTNPDREKIWEEKGVPQTRLMKKGMRVLRMSALGATRRVHDSDF